jgi:type IV fimbrial biogenesis protein FimT
MRRLHDGFTMIEMMSALAVIAVLFGLAVPSFSRYMGQNRATAAQNDLATAMNLARSEALKRASPVSVCASTTGNSCAAGAVWSSGWIAFTDSTGARGTVDGPQDEILQRWTAVEGAVLFEVTPGASGTLNAVTFGADGMNAADEAFQIDVLWVHCGGDRRLRTIVSAVGSIQASRQRC